MSAFAFILKLHWGWHWVPSYVPCCITLGMKEYEDDNLYYVLLFTFTGRKEWVLLPSFWGCIEPALCQSLVPSFVPCCFTLGIREYEALPCFAASLNECFCLHFEAAWAGLGLWVRHLHHNIDSTWPQRPLQLLVPASTSPTRNTFRCSSRCWRKVRHRVL